MLSWQQEHQGVRWWAAPRWGGKQQHLRHSQLWVVLMLAEQRRRQLHRQCVRRWRWLGEPLPLLLLFQGAKPSWSQWWRAWRREQRWPWSTNARECCCCWVWLRSHWLHRQACV